MIYKRNNKHWIVRPISCIPMLGISKTILFSAPFFYEAVELLHGEIGSPCFYVSYGV